MAGLAAGAIGCASDPHASESDLTQAPTIVRVVEVLSTPNDGQLAFVELRNDAETPANLKGMRISADQGGQTLRARGIVDSAEASRGVDPNVVAPHGLALVVDARATDEQIERMACEARVATSREALGEEHSAENDILAGTIALQALPHCIPVFEVPNLREGLANASVIELSTERGTMDRAAAKFSESPRGVSYERRNGTSDGFELSPIGATPGARNFYRSDWAYLENGDAPLPISTYSSSPWRVGDLILSLRRQAEAAVDAGDAAAAEQLFAQADAVAAGEIPDNPLAEPMLELMGQAQTSVLGSFYQMNHHRVIDGFVEAKGRGLDVRLTTDAVYMGHQHYEPGFELLRQAGVPLVFDTWPDGRNRAGLSHNKFLTVDSEWLWTGSFNPIEDEPSSIHADNSLRIRSKAAVSLHEQEFETMFGGTFSTAKRKVGVGGGRANVDGAPISIRFSPGMTNSVLKRRSDTLADTGDALAACDTRLASGKNAIPERYRALDPCGGPYDLIVGELARATSSVYFLSFSLSLGDLGDVVQERIRAGVDVRGVADPTVYGRGVISDMVRAGADVRYTPNSNPECPAYVSPRTACPTNPNKVWLHHKFLVIDYGTDHPVVITGSHNLSASAESKNDEALVVIRDRAVAEAYFRMFREAYNHPQTLGTHRDTTGLPGLAITEVKGAADPSQTQFVEIANFGDDAVPLTGLELWNRRGEAVAIDSEVVLDPGARAVVTLGDPAQLGIDPSVPVLSYEANPVHPTIDLRTSLVLRTAADRRWIATFDPRTAEQNLPEGASVAIAGASQSWEGFDAGTLDALMVELLGFNTTPTEEVPTWDPKGLYSDWADEHHVTPTSMILMHATRGAWTTTDIPTPGR